MIRIEDTLAGPRTSCLFSSETEISADRIIARLDDLLRDAARYRYARDELSPEDFATIPAEELNAFIDVEIAREGLQ